MGAVKVFANYYGLVPTTLLGPAATGVAKFPPTISFHNEKDPVVPVSQNSVILADVLNKAGITHDPVCPFSWYNDDWEQEAFHAFRPGGHADVDSRARSKTWITRHMPATGRPLFTVLSITDTNLKTQTDVILTKQFTSH